MDLLEEYDDMIQLPTHVAISYKFFVPFRIDGGELVWSGHRAELDEEAIGPIKAFLKATKALLREGNVSKGECSRRMWFWYAKLVDMALFQHDARVEILRWMEVCELVLV